MSPTMRRCLRAGSNKAPIAPIAPALATATLNATGHAPAIGASRMGTSRPWTSQKFFTRARADDEEAPQGEISGPGIGKSFTFAAQTAISRFRRLGRDGARTDRR